MSQPRGCSPSPITNSEPSQPNASRHAPERRVFAVAVLVQVLHLFPEFGLVQRLVGIGPANYRVVPLEVDERAVACRQQRAVGIIGLDIRTRIAAVPDPAKIRVAVRRARCSLGAQAKRRQAQNSQCGGDPAEAVPRWPAPRSEVFIAHWDHRSKSCRRGHREASRPGAARTRYRPWPGFHRRLPYRRV